MDEIFEDAAVEKIVECAEVLAQEARRLCPVGTVSRPIYLRGKYKGQAWTARDAGQLERSVRVTRKKSKSGKVMYRRRDVRVYAGHYLAYYASIVEHAGKPFMRTALAAAHSDMQSILKGGSSG